jgi:hypothetical protein
MPDSWSFVKLDERKYVAVGLAYGGELAATARAGRRKEAARLRGMERGLRLHERDSYGDRAGGPDSMRKVRPRRRDRCRGKEKSANAVTWSRPLFLSSPLGTTWVPSLSLLSLLARSTVPSRFCAHQDALNQHRGPPPPRLPKPPRPRARNTRPRCCRRGEVEDAMIQRDQEDALGAFIRISIVPGVSQLMERCVRTIRCKRRYYMRSPPPAPASRSASPGIRRMK